MLQASRTARFFFLSLALAVAAKPVVVPKSPVTLKLSRRLNLTSIHNLVRHDQARAKVLKARGCAGAIGERAVINQPVDNQAVTYVASVAVGSPATSYSLLIDTGSSNTWVGSHTKYVKTSTSTTTLNRVSVEYGSGSFYGTEYIDQVSFGNGLVIPKQSIGVATTSTGFDGVDGILGIGPIDLTVGSLSPDTTSSIPTVTDNLFTGGNISAHEIGISFQPTTSAEIMNGELTWGGVDKTKYIGTIGYSRTSTFPANEYWGVDQSIRYGPSTSILSATAGIVDTGTTLVLLATDAYAKYILATGAVVDSATGLLRISAAGLGKLQSLFFTTGGVTYEFTANAQLWPRALNRDIGGVADAIYLIVGDLGTYSGEGLDFINGYAFLERFYSVYDTTNQRVGLANTPYTRATSN